MLLSRPWKEGWEDNLTNPQNCQTALYSSQSRQQPRFGSGTKQRRARPQSVSQIQRRLEYLERKMQSINLEESSFSDDSELDMVGSKRLSPALYLSDKKVRSNHRILSRPSARKSPKEVQAKQQKQSPTYRKKAKPPRHESVSIQEPYEHVRVTFNGKPLIDNGAKPRRSKQTQQTKSLNHKNVHSYGGEIGSRHEVERTINLSDKSLSEYSLKKRGKYLKIEHERKKLKKIEKELLRFQKQNKLLRCKLKLFEGLQQPGKKAKPAGLLHNQRSDLSKKPTKEGSKIIQNGSAIVAGRAPTRRNHNG